MKFFKKIGKGSKRVIGYETHKDGIGMIKDFIVDTKDRTQKKTFTETPDTRFDDLSENQAKDFCSRFNKISIAFAVLAVIAILTLVRFVMEGDYFYCIFSLAFLGLCAVNFLKFRYLIFRIKKPSAPNAFQGFMQRIFEKSN